MNLKEKSNYELELLLENIQRLKEGTQHEVMIAEYYKKEGEIRAEIAERNKEKK
jgi:hypothetical protein